MKKTILFLSILFLSNLIILNAQTEVKNYIKSFGFGLHFEQFKIDDWGSFPINPVNKVILTLSPSQKLRIEPEFGFRFETDKISNSKNSTFDIGIGAFGMKQQNRLNFYGGFRFDFILMFSEGTRYEGGNITKVTYKSNRLLIGPALGAEYYLGENFTLGGEVSILFATCLRTINPNPEGDPDTKIIYTGTNSGLFIRFYF